MSKWLDTFISEKGIDPEELLIVEGQSGTNYLPVGCVVEAIKSAPQHEQAQIKTVLVKIDFTNGSVLHFLQHLAGAIAI